MHRSVVVLGRVFGAALLVTTSTAQAQVVGTLNAAGSALFSGTATNVAVTPSTSVIALPPIAGIFSLIATGTMGTMQPIVVGQGPMGLPNYITLAGYTFSLSNIPAGSFTSAACTAVAAAGQTCTPAGSGFSFTNASDGQAGFNSTGAFNFSGTVITPGSLAYSYTGVLTSQFVGQSYQQVLANLGTSVQGASYSLNIQATGSGTIINVVPEPASMALMATGLLFIGGFVRRRRSAV